jgi:hypothetical protein
MSPPMATPMNAAVSSTTWCARTRAAAAQKAHQPSLSSPIHHATLGRQAARGLPFTRAGSQPGHMPHTGPSRSS